MISSDEALARIFDLIEPLPAETVPLRKASGRIMAKDAIATRDQPPFPASAMDGYCISADNPNSGDEFNVIGEAAAGTQYEGRVGKGQAVRIFTGAPVPEGAARIIIQEDVTRIGDTVTIGDNIDTSLYVRAAGTDFKSGASLPAPRRLSPADIALLAAMNMSEIPVFRRPKVALIATGDELVMPGETPRSDQIIASNSFGLAALLERENADVRLLPIARDTTESLSAVFDLAQGADLIVTIGGASVGDHDLVGQVASGRGMQRSFYKIAMRPGKPLMAGLMDDTPMIGLPGNPVSSIVCGHIFLRPVISALQGLPKVGLSRREGILASDIPANGTREHFMRARVEQDQVTVAERQDSSLLSVLADANALVVRPINDHPRRVGDRVQLIEL